ncbi:MAG: nucleotide exchange factor GrpE [Pseudomonadota bacterium]
MSVNPEDNKDQDPLAPEDISAVETDQASGNDIPAGEEAVRENTQQEDAQADPEMDYPRVVEALRTELDQTKDQAMRALAEAENARRRAQKDREEASKFAVSSFAKDLLSIADNLRRAIDAVPDDLKEDVRVENLIGGIEATERELLKTFEKNNIEKVEPVTGQAFDPNFHEVMFEAPGTGQPAGSIIEVIEVGYILNGRILRPARVGVAKDEGQAGAAPKNDPEPGANIDTEA